MGQTSKDLEGDIRRALDSAGIDPGLWSIFLPQLEQMKAQIVAVPYGVGGRIALPSIEGWFWGCAVAPDCLVTSMRLSQRRDFTLVEKPEVDYYVLTRFTPWDANLMNELWSAPTIAPLPSENLAAFAMSRGTHDFPMTSGSSHGGCTISMLPSFLDRQLGTHSSQVRQALHGHLDLNRALELRGVMRNIEPSRALRPGAALYFRAKVLEALSELEALVVAKEGDATGGRGDDRALVERVRSILDASLAQPPSLNELAEALGMGKTALCSRFKEQTGETVGAYLLEMRMAQAKLHLQNGEAVARVASAVGYQSVAAFCTAFRRATGLSPRAWRASVKSC